MRDIYLSISRLSRMLFRARCRAGSRVVRVLSHVTTCCFRVSRMQTVHITTRRPRAKSCVVVHRPHIVFARRVLSCVINSPRLESHVLIKLLN
jgi:hypothetical protein